MKIASEWMAYGEAFLRLLFPAVCSLCEKPLLLTEADGCADCQSQLDVLALSEEQKFLTGQNFLHADQVWALYPYRDAVKKVLHQVKFQRMRQGLKLFQAPLSAWALAIHSENHYDLIIPVPLSRKKLMTREFNQAGILAGFIRQATGVPVAETILKKKNHIESQSHLNRRERMLNLSGVFSAQQSSLLKGKRILLVDDILTTGATVEEASKILKQNGAQKIDVLVLAHTSKSL